MGNQTEVSIRPSLGPHFRVRPRTVLGLPLAVTLPVALPAPEPGPGTAGVGVCPGGGGGEPTLGSGGPRLPGSDYSPSQELLAN